MTKKHTERKKEANQFNPLGQKQTETAPKGAGGKPNGHDQAYFTGAGQGKSETFKTTFTAEDVVLACNSAARLGYQVGHKTGHRCQAEHDFPVIRNQRERLKRAGTKVARLKHALIASNYAISLSTEALTD
jgi:large exoprotein involved in heme utilization and adhesion